MKNALLIITSICLFACSESNKESINNVSAFNESSTKLKILSLYSEKIYELNKKVQLKYGYDSTHLEIFKRFDDTLLLIRNELIEATGGYTLSGEYINAPATEDVHAFFYGEAIASKFFFESLDVFEAKLKKINPHSQLLEEINNRFNILINIYGLKSGEMIFNNLTISEAVMLLESIRSQIALEQTDYLLLH